MKKSLYILLLFFSELNFITFAQQSDFNISVNGQFAVWTTFGFQDPLIFQPGARFVPALLGNWKISEQNSLDFEASLNLNGSFTIPAYQSFNAKLKPYRVWMRYSGEKYEMRAGLQKINFGSAKMFRPLMWFDEMDVRDPLQLTDGVYGLLGKYFFENNANIWLWSLYGNNETKGFEFVSTKKNSPEFGGRLELPLGPGEIGFATHNRKIISYDMLANSLTLDENRIGLNGKWDVGVGLWVEGSWYFTQKNELIPKTVSSYNAGVDYTFPLGNGFGVSMEYFRYEASETEFLPKSSMNLLGLMFNYPLTIDDQLSTIVFALPSQNQFFRYISWTKTMNDLVLYAIAYWNPNTNFSIAQLNSDSRLFQGTGVQLMLSYDFSKNLTNIVHR